MSNFISQQKEGQEGQEGQEYVIVFVNEVSNPPPSDAVATAPTSLLSAMMSVIDALRPNVNLHGVAVAVRNGLSVLGHEIVSCSTSVSEFLQGKVATPKNIDDVCGVMETAGSHLVSALSSSASAISHSIFRIHQDFDTYSRVVNINGVRFVQIGPNILWVSFDNGTVCGYRFPVKNLNRIEMFHLTSAICMFLLHETDGRVFASVYTTHYGRDITCLNRVTQIGEDDRFNFFETSDVCIHGTVGLTMFYKDRSQLFFRVERDGAIRPIFLICDSQDDKSM